MRKANAEHEAGASLLAKRSATKDDGIFDVDAGKFTGERPVLTDYIHPPRKMLHGLSPTVVPS